MSEVQCVTAVYRIVEHEETTRFVVVEIRGQRCPQSLAQRLNERQGMNRTINLAAVFEGNVPAAEVDRFQPAQRATSLEDAQDIALRGAWKH